MKLGALLLLLVAGCRPTGPTGPVRSATLTPCHVTGLDEESLCGTIEVWEDRAARAGRRIPLRVLVVPSVRPVPEPDPLFFLAGGPGQGATGVAAQVIGAFDGLHERRDLVFVDQRGTGASNRLDCEDDEDATLDEVLGHDLPTGRLAACRDGLDADLSQYTTPVAMDDLDEVRAALGYERINLYGASYGTRAALVYLRRHPDRVRTLVLDGAAPPSMRLFLEFASDAEAAFEAAVRDCAAEPACRAAFPDPAGDLATLLAQPPGRVEVTHPRSGERSEVTVDRDMLASSVRALLYAPELTALLPLDLAAARGGDVGPLLAQVLAVNGASVGGALVDGPGSLRPDGGLALGMMLSVVCTEDVDRYTREEAVEAARGTFLGPSLATHMIEACADWPRGTLPAGYHDVVRGDAPTLVLSGALDPVTPPRVGAEAAAGLTHVVHGVAPGAAHNVVFRGCADDLVEQLVESGSVEGLDTSCLDRVNRSAFFVDAAGPPR